MPTQKYTLDLPRLVPEVECLITVDLVAQLVGCGVEPVALIGECLMQRSQQYFHQPSYPKLADLCRRIGSPLPDHPLQNAWDRARGQIHLVEAMSQGITAGRGEPEQRDVDDSEEDDEPPF